MINKVTILGRLGRDPEIRTMQNGGKVANLVVATSEKWKDKNSGDQREKTEWHRVVIFDEYALNAAEKWLKKGARVYIEGELQTRKWQDSSGADKYTTEIILNRFRGVLKVIDFPEDSAQQQPTDQGGGGDLDDEIPF